MKLILTQDVDNVGNEGDVVDVKPGFGRNFLIPQKLAITFSKSQLKQVEEKRSLILRFLFDPKEEQSVVCRGR